MSPHIQMLERKWCPCCSQHEGPTKDLLRDFVVFVKCHYKDFPRLLYKFWMMILNFQSPHISCVITLAPIDTHLLSLHLSDPLNLKLHICLLFLYILYIHLSSMLEWDYRIHVDCGYIKRIDELHTRTQTKNSYL